MLKSRLLMSAVLIPTLALIFWLDAGTGQTAALFGPLCLLLSGLAARELVGMARNRVPTLTRVDTVLACVSLAAAGWGAHFLTTADTPSPALGPAPAVSAAAVCGSVALTWLLVWLLEAAVRYERGTLRPGEVLSHVAAKLLVLGYAGGLTAATMQLRWAGPTAWDGYRLLAALLVAVKSADVGAYFIGRQFGRRHPLRRLSPGKTEAGFIGALVVGSLAFTAWMLATGGGTGATASAVVRLAGLGLLLAGGGVVGDLVESLFKRECGVKDSSSLLPGFGGVLDVLDSVLFVGSVAATATTLAAVLGLGTP